METEGKSAIGDADRKQGIFTPPGRSAAPPPDVPEAEHPLAIELAAANARADEHKAQHLYALAEVENVKKRAERQIAERVAQARKAMLVKFLPVLDNFERALSFDADAKGLRGGLEATLRGFEALLASEEIKPIAVVGAPFDPRTAEAIGTQVDAGVAEDTVTTEVQRGYTIGTEVLRPARVLVAKRPD